MTAASERSGAAANTRSYTLSAVSCVSETDCFVVGAVTDTAGYPATSTTLILRWNGTSWSNLHGVNRAGFAANSLFDVSCTAPDFCMAVGESAKTASSSVRQALIERWDGKTWTLLPSRATVRALSCVTKKLCMGTTLGSLQRWDGRKWATVAVPASPVAPRYGGVACVDERHCVAVASYDTNIYQSHLVTIRWNGKRWAPSAVTDADIGESADFSDASCGSPAACMAVGSSTGGFYSYGVFAQRWDGTRWSASAATAPSAIVSRLNGVSCPSPVSCFAAGGLNSGPGPAGYPHPFVDGWNGTDWSVASAPNLYGGLANIDCGSSTSCLAIGYSQTNPDLYVFKTLALRFDGTTWKRIPSPNPV